jgi:acetone carboxylase alpha subunit
MSYNESEFNVTEESSDERITGNVEPPIGWDGQTLREMLEMSNEQFEQTGHYSGIEELQVKSDQPFEYETIFSKLRGAVVSARETALNIASSAITSVAGELCFQIYTPEGDCVVPSTGILVHIHTGTLAIKHIIEDDYEHGRGINPGDIFCNNDSDIGNVHTSDIHTLVPIFHDDELIAWVDGVTHQVDVGGITPGESLIASTSRYNDGISITCEKIGENDELYQDWRKRMSRAVRTPDHWDLDEKCRLAGCHMVREAVHELIEDVGVDTYKQFAREAIEDSRRTFRESVKDRFFPGVYRESSFMPVPFEDEAWMPNAQQDHLNHLPVEIEIEGDGTLKLDMDGASPPGPHSYNAAEGSMAGGLWVALTQFLPLEGKVNDGSHFAMETNFPEGSIVNTDDHTYSFGNSWGTILPMLNGLVKCTSRGFQARGFVEEISAGHNRADTVKGGATYEPTDEHYPINPFEISTGAMGPSGVRDGLDFGYGVFNPECEMGDVETWEKIEKGLLYLGRRVKPNTAGHGKYRGGTGWEVVRVVRQSSDVSIYKNRHAGVTFSSYGMDGGYPHAESYAVRAHDTDFFDRIAEQEPYPTDDRSVGTFNDEIEGDITATQRGLYWPKEFENGDLLHYQIHGAPGFGDPLDRAVESVKEDVEDEVFTPDIVERVYGVVGDLDEWEFTVDEEATAEKREELLDERKAETRPAREFYEEERERIRNDDMSEPVLNMYEGVFEQSEEWATRFREFWNLDAAEGGEDDG